MAKIRAPVFVNAKKPLEMREFDHPELREEEVLVKMKIAGICGSDARIWQNPRAEFGMSGPIIFGHENVGVVDEMGPQRRYDYIGQELNEGDYVVFASSAPCKKCYTCNVLNEPALCENGVAYGLSPITELPYLRGGYGEYVHIVPNAGIIKIPDKSYINKALLAVIGNKTIAAGFRIMNGMTAGDTVVVQGSGPIGLAATLQSRLSGASRIITIGAPENRLRIAKQLGATDTIYIDDARTPEERVKLVNEFTGGTGADIVIEASGGRTAIDEGLEMARKGGKYLLIGIGERKIDPFPVTRKNLRVYGSYSATPADLHKSISAMRNVELPFEKLFTHRFAIDEATEGLKAVDSLEPVIALIDFDK